jgi:hypothetical protein
MVSNWLKRMSTCQGMFKLVKLEILQQDESVIVCVVLTGRCITEIKLSIQSF